MREAPQNLPIISQQLPWLYQQLRSAGFSIGTDTMLNVQRLLKRLAAMGQLPNDQQQFAAYLQPLLCQSHPQQQSFQSIWASWWQELEAILAAENRRLEQEKGQGNGYISPEALSPNDSGKSYADQSHVDQGYVNKSKAENSVSTNRDIESSPPALKGALSHFVAGKKQGYLAALKLVLAVLIVALSGVFFWGTNFDPVLGKGPQATALKTPQQHGPKPSHVSGDLGNIGNISEHSLTNNTSTFLPSDESQALKLDSVAKAQLKRYQTLITLLPVLLIILLLLWQQLRRRYFLNKHKANKHSPLQHLGASESYLQPFAKLDLSGAFGRGPLVPSRRYHLGKTLQASLRQFGAFVPVYRQARQPVTLLLLVDRRHREDLQGELAAQLAQQFRAEGVRVEDYEFNRDPRYCIPRQNNRQARKMQSLNKVISAHSDAYLLLIGDAHGLFNPFRGELLSWSKQAFAAIQHKVLLTTTAHPWGGHEAQLSTQLGFHVTPFSREGIDAVQQWLTGQQRQPQQNNVNAPQGLWFLQQQASLPPRILGHYEQWLSSAPPADYHFDALVADLAFFCRPKGVELMVACAIYPEVLPKLTTLLNIKLFPDDPPEEREARLLRLNQLPWFRYAQMPQYLRQDLMGHVSPKRLKAMTQLYSEIFAQLHLAPSATGAVAGFARQQDKVADKRRFNLKQWLNHMPANSRLADRVFVDTMLQFRPSLGQLLLPKQLADPLRGNTRSRWLISMAAGAALLSYAIVTLSWKSVWQHDIEARLLRDMLQANQRYRVQLITNSDTEFMGTVLASQLHQYGFNLSQKARSGSEEFNQQQGINNLPSDNTIDYAPDAERQVQQIIGLIDELVQGAESAPDQEQRQEQNPPSLHWQLQADNRLQPHQVIRLQLNSLPAAITHQILAQLQQQSAQQAAKSLPYEPDMVAIPSGQFLMGSTPEAVQNNLAYDTELPQHRVQITGFYLSATEVTFSQYQVFAQATQRTLPDDQGWGREDHPIINVNWHDAMAYTQWLARETGKPYRLPTEAEWEYAARGGTTTAFHTGECLSGHQANVRDNIDYGPCKASQTNLGKTAQVASYPANPFGLYDMHGNIWEWTADCWHDNYQNAPNNGSAWITTQANDNAGDPSTHNTCPRVVRGGSWLYLPQSARSADRYRSNQDGANSAIGFRVAMGVMVAGE